MLGQRICVQSRNNNGMMLVYCIPTVWTQIYMIHCRFWNGICVQLMKNKRNVEVYCITSIWTQNMPTFDTSSC